MHLLRTCLLLARTRSDWMSALAPLWGDKRTWRRHHRPAKRRLPRRTRNRPGGC